MCIVVQIRHRCSIGGSPYIRKINSDEEMNVIFGSSENLCNCLDLFALIQGCHFTIMTQLISVNVFVTRQKRYTFFNIRKFHIL